MIIRLLLSLILLCVSFTAFGRDIRVPYWLDMQQARLAELDGDFATARDYYQLAFEKRPDANNYIFTDVSLVTRLAIARVSLYFCDYHNVEKDILDIRRLYNEKLGYAPNSLDLASALEQNGLLGNRDGKHILMAVNKDYRSEVRKLVKYYDYRGERFSPVRIEHPLLTDASIVLPWRMMAMELAGLYYNMGNYMKALEEYRKAIPRVDKPDFSGLYGHHSDRLGHWNHYDANSGIYFILDYMILHWPRTMADIFDEYGDVLKRTGHGDEAVAARERAHAIRVAYNHEGRRPFPGRYQHRNPECRADGK